MPAPKKNKNAEKNIQWDMVDKLLEINCTGEEIATILEVDYDTIQNHCKKEKGMLFSEYIKKGNEKFKVSLKRLQFRSAKGVFTQTKDGETKMLDKPSVAMQVWLGKQYLEQVEKQEIKTSGNLSLNVDPFERIRQNNAISEDAKNKEVS